MNYESLSEAELVKLAATQIMGWPADTATRPGSVRQWNPLTDDTAVFAVVEELNCRNSCFRLIQHRRGATASFHNPNRSNFKGRYVAKATSHRRAIVIAALMATEARG